MKRNLFLLSAWVLAIAGCGGGASPPDNRDVVVTAQESSFSFSSAKTYFLAEDVLEITDAPPGGSPTPTPSATPPSRPTPRPSPSVTPTPSSTPTPSATPSPAPSATPSATPSPSPTASPGVRPTALDPETKQTILNTIVAQMTARGYTRLTDPNGPKPDVFIQASVMRAADADVYYTYWYSYWGGYYDPWYGSIYAGYAPVPVPYIETSVFGALIMEFTDPNNPDNTNKKLPSVWAGVVSGALDGATSPEVRKRVEDGINQAFEQSPYIRSGQ